ncbi:hypothetical protein B566_EDAN001313 [Ephemera danica]|nr:hypothetical protein B566_EDAN001313 [Ephemera danica]
MNTFGLSETEKEIEVIETEVERIRKDKAELQKNRESSRKEVEQKNNEVKKAERQLQVARAELEALNQQLTNISKGSQQDELARLESRKKHFEEQKLALENLLKKKETLDTKKALEKLFKQGKLSKMPIGPIGTHIRVKDPQWELAVEIILKSEFKCFFVNSDEDRKLVTTLANKILGSSCLSIVTSQFIPEVYNVASGKVKSVPNDGLFNLMDMLIVDKPEVMNYLIDQKGVESILLCEDLNRAFDLMGSVKTVPKNCSMMITTEGEQIYPAPLYRYYSAEANAKVQYLIRNSEHDLQSEAKEIEKSAAQVATEEKEVEALNKEVQSLEKQLKATRSELTALEAEELNLRKQIEANRLEELDTSQSAFAKVKEDCLETQALVEEKVKHVKQLMQELTTAKDEDKSVEKQISELMSHLKDVQNKKKQIEAKKTEIDNDIISENARESCLLKSLESLEEKETFILKTVDALEKRVAKANELGRTVCEKIQTTRCPQDICKEIEELNSFIKAIGSRISDPKMVSQQIQDCEEAQVTLRQQITRIKMAHEELSNAMLQRRSLYNLKIQMIFLQIADLFKLYFVNQSFQGNIQFTHSKRLMTLSLNWRHHPFKNLTNPSGGERTFSIIALILAVWERMRFPFYILDEFDVYMDMVNRHHCTDMLVQMARSRRRYQYIFLTPQDSNLRSEEDLTIHQLADPRPNGVSLA